jgi:hypothetical protein
MHIKKKTQTYCINKVGPFWIELPEIGLKGQSHEKVGEIRIEGDSQGPN